MLRLRWSMHSAVRASMAARLVHPRTIMSRPRRLEAIEALSAFKTIFGHVDVPPTFVVPHRHSEEAHRWPSSTHGINLGRRITKLRASYKQDLMPPAETTVLDRLGFVWDHKQRSWRRTLLAFETYKEVHGHLHVPTKFVVPSGAPWPGETWGLALGRKVNSIRGCGAHIKRHPERRARLEALGFVFGTHDEIHWDATIRALAVYDGIHGDLLVPVDFVVPACAPWPDGTWGMQLGKQVSNIRTHRTLMAIEPKRRAVLDSMGFVWVRDTTESHWQSVKQLLHTYKTLHGDLLVPTAYVVPNEASWPADSWGCKLGAIVGAIRSGSKFVEHSAERRQQLDDMGFVWSIDDWRWERLVRMLQVYHDENGNILVPSKFAVPSALPWPEEMWGTRLGMKLAAIRCKGSFVKDRPDRRAELDALGFVWDTREEDPSLQRSIQSKDWGTWRDLRAKEWRQITGALDAYKGVHGDLLVPPTFVVPQDTTWPREYWDYDLGSKVHAIRHGENKWWSTFAWPAQCVQLQAMGFDWDPTGQRWEHTLQALARFRELHGSALVHAGFCVPASSTWPTDLWHLPLGREVNAIRNSEMLVQNCAQRRAQLDALDFVWELSADQRRWDLLHTALIECKSAHGHVAVPATFVVPSTDSWSETVWGMKLGARVADIRHRSAFIHGSQERRAELDALGFAWHDSTRVFSWPGALRQDVMAALRTYHEEYGCGGVPAPFVVPSEAPWPAETHGLELGAQVKEIRAFFRCPLMSLEHADWFAELNELNFDWDLTGQLWDVFIQALEVYKHIHDDLLVPSGFIVPAAAPWSVDTWGLELGRQVTRARRLKANTSGEISEERRAQLDCMNFAWSVQHRGVHKVRPEIFAALRTYRGLNNHGVPAGKFVVPDESDPNSEHWPPETHGMKLGQEVSALRTKQKNGQISVDDTAKLDTLGFVWDLAEWRWQNMFEALLVYKQKYDTCFIPPSFVVPSSDPWPQPAWGKRMARWCARIRDHGREQYAIDFPERSSKLDSLDFIWDMLEPTMTALYTFKDLYKHLVVATEFVVPKCGPWSEATWGLNLGQQVARIRSENAQHEQHDELSALGFAWTPDDWAPTVVVGLIAYHEHFGHANVPFDFVIPHIGMDADKTPGTPADWPQIVHGLALGLCARDLRRERKRDTLSNEDIAKLDAIGFIWDLQSARTNPAVWQKLMEVLLVYKEVNGDVLVPAKFVVPSEAPWPEHAWGVALGRRVSAMRGRKHRIHDMPTHKAKLDALGFEWGKLPRNSGQWTRQAVSWDVAIASLKFFRAQHNTLDVPHDFVVPSCETWPEEAWGIELGALAREISSDGRFLQGHPERHALLDDLGLQWDAYSPYMLFYAQENEG